MSDVEGERVTQAVSEGLSFWRRSASAESHESRDLGCCQGCNVGACFGTSAAVKKHELQVSE